MPSEEVRVLKMDGAIIRSALDQMDEDSSSAESGIGGDDVRDAGRFAYRVRALTIEFADAAGGWTKHVVPSRNISRGGLSILMNHFVYTGTRCRVHLLSLHNHAQAVAASVARCRYLPGSGRLHEVGVKFDKPIDIALFHRGASHCRILLIDDDKSIHQLLPRLLNTMTCEFENAYTAEQGIAAAAAASFDVVLMDVDMEGTNGIDAARELRNRGYSRPIVAVTAMSDETTKTRCLEAGCTMVATKPLDRDGLTALIRSLTSEPLVSSMIHDRAMVPLIDTFVRELPERMTKIEQAFAEKNLETVEKVARQIKGSASTHGFESITLAAAELEAALIAKKDAIAIRERVNELVKLCFAARPVTFTQAGEQKGK